jgi:hypothetical protein
LYDEYNKKWRQKSAVMWHHFQFLIGYLCFGGACCLNVQGSPNFNFYQQWKHQIRHDRYCYIL